MVIAAVAIFAIGRIANKETNNQKKLDALTIEYQTVTNDSLKNVINSAGDIDVSVYTDDSVNVLKQFRMQRIQLRKMQVRMNWMILI